MESDKIKVCEICNKKFQKKDGCKGRFCSYKCYWKSMEGKTNPYAVSHTSWNKGKKHPAIAGEKHFAWKGGRSRGYKTGYYSAEYKRWRISVFERDSFTCQSCRQIGGYITAHHIKSFTYYPKLRFELDNGITLCEECHKLTDNYGGKAKRKR